MIKHTIEISGYETDLNVSLNQLEVRRNSEVIGKIPIEDIGLLIVDTPTARYSHQTVIRILFNGGAILFCNEKHLPAGLLLPIASNSLQSRRMRCQATASKPLLKQLWKQIIQQKIHNQANLLKELGLIEADVINGMVEKVYSGDPQNIESQASRKYWPALFGKEFRRSRAGRPPNSLLNYGYTIIRAAVARAISGSGVNPSLGIHHSNQYNSFALADDLFEPLRPLVDRVVYDLHIKGSSEVTIETKKTMLSLLGSQVVKTSNSNGPLLVALERYAISLCQCFCGKQNSLEIPQIWT